MISFSPSTDMMAETLTVNFSEHFWGEKFQGYDVLYHNMKHGQKSCNDFLDFIKELMIAEENFSKSLGKLSKQVGNGAAQGSFFPYWGVLRESVEKGSSLHQQLVIKLQELLKDVQKYLEEQIRKHKTMKDAEAETANIVQSIQNQQSALLKSKEVYIARNQELEKCRKDNAGAKDVERAEARLRKATEDYRTNVEKYAAMRLEFERKMSGSAARFQDLEEQHLRQMLQFAEAYCGVNDLCAQTCQEIAVELRRKTEEMTVAKFLSLFVKSKATGADRPAAIEFEEMQVAASVSPSPQPFPVTSNIHTLLSFDSDDPFGPSASPPVNLMQSSIAEEPAAPTQPVEKRGLAFLKKRNNGELQNGKLGVKQSDKEAKENENPAKALERNIRQSGQGDGPLQVNGQKTTKETNGKTVIDKNEPVKNLVESRRKFPSLKNIFGHGKAAEEPRSEPKNALHSIQPIATNLPSKAPSSSDLQRQPLRVSKWFFSKKEKKEKKEKDKSKSKRSKENNASNTATSSNNLTTGQTGDDAKSESSFGSHSLERSSESPQVDADGFIIRPTNSDTKSRSDSYRQYQSSSDSDSDKDEPQKKLHVVIKPPTIQPNKTGPVDDRHLRDQATKIQLGNLGYSYTGGKRATTRMEEMMRRSTSASSDPNFSTGFGASAVDGTFFSSPPVTGASSGLIMPQKTGGSVVSNPWDSTPDFSASNAMPTFPAPSLSIPPRNTQVNLNTTNFLSQPAVQIPLAVAFVEKVSAKFVGADESKCQTRVEGDLILTFPSSVLQMLLSNPSHPPLTFRLNQTHLLEHILPNKHLVTQETRIDDGRITYSFNMPNLTNHLKKQSEAKAIPQPYQNVPVLKYQLGQVEGWQAAPIILIAYWKHEETTTSLRIDYRRNSAHPPLRGCQISVPVAADIDVTSMSSIPSGDWSPSEHVARWSVLEPSTELASIKARFEHPAASFGKLSGPIGCSFQAEGVLMSKVLFELVSDGYKVTVVKMRMASAKYVCEAM